ncbi:MAG: transcription-repair coupling factor, partial [Bacteroidales bacterium]|nr:transcription-repair coupling factor [Bacteroidales bacterium]
MKIQDIAGLYLQSEKTSAIVDSINTTDHARIWLKGLKGSVAPLMVSSVYKHLQGIHLVVLEDKEVAAYFYNDLENLFGEREKEIHHKKVLFFPTSYKRPYDVENLDNANVLARTEVLKRIGGASKNLIIVSYGEALCEKVVTKSYISKNTLKISVGERLSLDFTTDVLLEYGFDRVEYVYEPGQFSLRGGIVDVWSYSDEYPYRIEFFGDDIESIRSFNPETQLSVTSLKRVSILPNIQERSIEEKHQNIIQYLPGTTNLWFDNLQFAIDQVDKDFKIAKEAFDNLEG